MVGKPPPCDFNKMVWVKLIPNLSIIPNDTSVYDKIFGMGVRWFKLKMIIKTPIIMDLYVLYAPPKMKAKKNVTIAI